MAAAVSTLAKQMQTQRDWGVTRRLPSGLEIPNTAVWINEIGYAPVPAYGSANQLQLIQHPVPTNWEAVITGLVFQTPVQVGVPANPGDMIYTVDVDRQLGDPATIGHPQKDFGAVAVPMGSMVPGQPWPVEWKFESGEIIRVKAYSVANVTPGAPNWVIAALVGWEWPARKADLL